MRRIKTQERRNRILELLESSQEPLPGSVLADRFKVTPETIRKTPFGYKAAGTLLKFIAPLM